MIRVFIILAALMSMDAVSSADDHPPISEHDYAFKLEMQLGYLMNAYLERPDVSGPDSWFRVQLDPQGFADAMVGWTRSDLMGPLCKCKTAHCAAGEFLRHNAYTLAWIRLQRMAWSATRSANRMKRPMSWRIAWSDRQLQWASDPHAWQAVRTGIEACLRPLRLTADFSGDYHDDL